MVLRQNKEINYYSFNIFDKSINHAIFTRRGGVSPKPWESLNMGGTVGDEDQRVLENKNKALAILGKRIDSVFDVWQVHGNNVVATRKPRLAESTHIQADGIITDQPGVTLMMRFADCVPLIFHDPVQKVIGIAHAGWLGIVNGIIPAMVRSMEDEYGTNPKDLLVGIGPSIGPDHYEVREDVVKQVQTVFGIDQSKVLPSVDGQMHFDLWEAAQLQLEFCGINQIENPHLCTACHLDDWFSYRAEHGHTGRFGACISLN